MSIKIYNAYYTENETIESIQNKIHSFYLNNKDNIEKHFYNKVLEEIIENYDSGLDTNINPFEIFYNGFKNDFIRSQLQNIRCNIDFSTTICFKNYNGKTYWKIFSEEPSIIALIEKYFDLKDYHYQNSTDKPFDISKEDWQNRKTTWDKLLTHYSFKESGFIIVELISFQPVDFLNSNELNNYLNQNINFYNNVYRVNKWFENNYFEFISSILVKLKPEINNSSTSSNILLKIYFKLNKKFVSFNNNEADEDTNKFFNILNNILKPTFLKYAPEIDFNSNTWDKKECYNKIKQKLNDNDFIKKYILNIIS